MRIRTVELRHEGNHRFSATTGTGRTITYGDDAAANEYSPVESVVASLAACSAMDVIGILEKKRQVMSSPRCSRMRGLLPRDRVTPPMRCTGAEPKEAAGEVVVTGPYRRPEIVPG